MIKMRKIALLPALLLAACASQYQAASQNYRPAGSVDAVEITGQLYTNYGVINSDHYAMIRFNGQDQIKVKLGNSFFGDGVGNAWHDKTTSASCSGQRLNKYSTEVRCMVFIGNEKTVTLTF